MVIARRLRDGGAGSLYTRRVAPPSLPKPFRSRRLAVISLVAVVGLALPGLAQTDPAAPPAEAPAPAPEPAPAPAPAPAPVPEPAPVPGPAPDTTADTSAAKTTAANTTAARKAAARRRVAAGKKAAARKAAARRAAVKNAASANSQPLGGVLRGSTLLDVDISSQTMRIYKGGKLYRSVPVSTGSGRRYCEKGRCGVAVTPRGTYRIYSHIRGWRTAALGRLYNPLYFRGGYAVHGGNLPGYPASHGCIRVSYSVASWLPSVAPVGTTIRVHN